LFSEPIFFLFGLLFSITIFCFFHYVGYPERNQKIISLKWNPFSFVCVLTLLSVLAVMLIPPYNGSILNASNVSIFNWIRYLSSILITSFLPGYFLLKLLDKKTSIGKAATVAFSYLLSIFLTFLEGFGILITGLSITPLASYVSIGLLFVLMITYGFVKVGNKSDGLTINLTEVAVLFSILMIIVVGSSLIMIYNLPLTSIDTWNIHNYSVIYSNGFPVYQDRLVPGYYYGMPIYLAVLEPLSGLPTSLAVQFLYVTFFIIPLSFYAAIKKWFIDHNHKGIPLIATLLSVTIGFGSLYFLYLTATNSTYNIAETLSLTSNTAYDIYLRIFYLPNFVAPLWAIGLPVFFMTIYLLKTDRTAMYLKGILLSILFALGYLSHPLEIGLIAIFLLVHSLIVAKRDVWKLKIFALFGLFFVFTVDFVAPAQLYVFPPDLLNGVPSPSIWFFVVVILVVFSVFFDYFDFKTRLSYLIKAFSRIKLFVSNNWYYLRWLLFYLYGLCLTIWLVLLDNFNVSTYGGPNYFAPFFVFPVRFGVLGALFFIGLFFYFKDLLKDKNVVLFLVWTILCIVMEFVSNYIPFYSSYRFSAFILIGVSIIAAFTIKNFICDKSRTKNKAISLLLLLLILPSALGTALFYIDGTYYYGRNTWASQQDIDAIDYIKTNLGANESVATFSSLSSFKLTALAGINPIQDFTKYSNLMLSLKDTFILTFMLGASNIRYIFVAHSDFLVINSSTGVFKDYLNFFSKPFSNEAVIIYEVPNLAKPIENASLGVLNFGEDDKSLNQYPDGFVSPGNNQSLDNQSDSLKRIGISLFYSHLNFSYTYLSVENNSNAQLSAYIQNFSNIVVTHDPINPSPDLLQWVQAGGNLLIFDTQGTGYYGRLFKLVSSESRITHINVGSGAIYYYNISSVPNNELSAVIQEFLNSISSEKINGTKISTVNGLNAIAEYHYSLGNMKILGDVSFSTNTLQLTGDITLKNDSHTNTLHNLFMTGAMELIIDQSDIELSPNNNSYMKITSISNQTIKIINPNTYPICIETDQENASASAIILTKDEPLYLAGNNLTIYVKSPSVDIFGQTTFNTLNLKSSTHTNTTLQGNIVFDVSYSSDNITFFSNFEGNAEFLTYIEGTGVISPHQEFTIPWINVLLSPYHFFLVCLLIFAALIYPQLRLSLRHKKRLRLA
jgi:hypothetical protein